MYSTVSKNGVFLLGSPKSLRKLVWVDTEYFETAQYHGWGSTQQTPGLLHLSIQDIQIRQVSSEYWWKVLFLYFSLFYSIFWIVFILVLIPILVTYSIISDPFICFIFMVWHRFSFDFGPFFVSFPAYFRFLSISYSISGPSLFWIQQAEKSVSDSI